MNQMEQIMEEMHRKSAAKQAKTKEEEPARRGCGCGAVD